MTRSCLTHAGQSHPSPGQSPLSLVPTRTGASQSTNCFSPSVSSPQSLTRACCTPGSPSLCRRRRSSSRSRRGSRCPRLRLSPAPLAPWAHTSQTCSAAREGETGQRWDCAASHSRWLRVTSLGNETQPRSFLSHPQWFCDQIKLNYFISCLSPPYFSFSTPLNGKVNARCWVHEMIYGMKTETTETTEYSLFTGAKQHSKLTALAFQKAVLSDFLESWRNCAVSGEGTGNEEKHQGKLKPPHSYPVQKTSKSKRQK